MEKTWKQCRKIVSSVAPYLGTHLIPPPPFLSLFIKDLIEENFSRQKVEGFVWLRRSNRRASSSADSTASLLLFCHKYLTSKGWACLTYQPVSSQSTGGLTRSHESGGLGVFCSLYVPQLFNWVRTRHMVLYIKSIASFRSPLHWHGKCESDSLIHV